MLSPKTKSRVSELVIPETVSALAISPCKWVKTVIADDGPKKLNINRLRFRNIPRLISDECTNAGRDNYIQNFWQSLTTQAMSGASCHAYYNKAIKFLKFADDYNFNPFTSTGVEYWIHNQHSRILKGEITEASASQDIGAYRKFISLCGLIPKTIFPEHNPFSERDRGKKDIRTLPYTKKEEKQLLVIIESLYRQLKPYVLNKSDEPFAEIIYKGKVFKLPCPTNLWPEHPANYWKIFVACAFYKLAAYTGYNTTTLTNLKLSQIQKIATITGYIYRLNPTKGRQGGMVDSKDISTAKMIAFFDDYLSLLPNLSYPGCEWVFPVFDIQSQLFSPLYNSHVTYRINTQIRRIFSPTDERGKPLKLSASRFRKNRNLIAHYVAGPIVAARDANHSIKTEDRYYGSIHPQEGMKQTAATVDVLAQLGQTGNAGSDIESAKLEVARKWNTELLPMDEAFHRYGVLKQMPNGVRCKNGYDGENPQKYRKMIFQSGKEMDETLPCAMYQSCLGCQQSVVIDCAEDAYLLMSFREFIANMANLHVDGNHLEKNYGELLSQLDTTITLLTPDHTNQAKQRLFENGLHPFWNRLLGS